ncbi:hypothetical protein HJC23_013320 [Cyclotella cryptica]|uniref:Uncharacterized protein n=1 Tax=Cyclotella cryptica TaxID=29204 RepID=A0ABD3Q0M2_9STRA
MRIYLLFNTLALTGIIHFASSFSLPPNFTPRQQSMPPLRASSSPSNDYDVLIIGSGIGGLCAAAMCTLYGYSTALFESHSVAGGAAHGFTVRAKDYPSYLKNRTRTAPHVSNPL